MQNNVDLEILWQFFSIFQNFWWNILISYHEFEHSLKVCFASHLYSLTYTNASKSWSYFLLLPLNENLKQSMTGVMMWSIFNSFGMND